MIQNNEFLNIQYLTYTEKKYDEAIEQIKCSPFFASEKYQHFLGQIYFLKLDLENAEKIFKKLNSFYELAYCYMLQNNFDDALKYFKISPSSPAQNWGLFFCELFTQKVTTVPSYLQIRSFLERDLALFLKLNLVELVQKTIDISEFLEQINPETNKIIARTFLYNNYPEYAKEYFIRAFDYTKNDAELYYLSGLYYKKINNLKEAQKSFKEALELNENYIPAQEQLNKL